MTSLLPTLLLAGAQAPVVDLGLEARLRHEGFAGHQWGETPDDGYSWLRLMPQADLRSGPFRGFAQGIAGYAIGLRAPAGPVDETGIDLLQGFGELRLDAGGTVFSVRGGRSLVALGSERLVGRRYGPNIPQAFDGVRFSAEQGPLRLDVLRLRPVAVGPRNLDDASSDERSLSGLYATMSAEPLSADLYLLSYRNGWARFAQGGAPERRTTVGARVFGTSGPWSWNWEAMVQRGRFGHAPIRAWSIAGETVYSTAPLLLRLRSNIASGDRSAADPALGTFNPLFPRGKYFGELSPIGPYNIVNLNPGVEMKLGRGVTAGFACAAYWRQSRGDGLYGLPGGVIRAPGGSTARFVGSQAEWLVEWQADRRTSIAASWSLFRPGTFLRDTGPARTIRMIGLEATFQL